MKKSTIPVATWPAPYGFPPFLSKSVTFWVKKSIAPPVVSLNVLPLVSFTPATPRPKRPETLNPMSPVNICIIFGSSRAFLTVSAACFLNSLSSVVPAVDSNGLSPIPWSRSNLFIFCSWSSWENNLSLSSSLIVIYSFISFTSMIVSLKLFDRASINDLLLLIIPKLELVFFKARLATLSIVWIDSKKLPIVIFFLGCSNSSSSILLDTLFLLSL